MTQYLLQIEDSTKRLIKSYEVTAEHPVRTIVPEGRTQIIIEDTDKFHAALAVLVQHKLNTYANNIVDFTKNEPITRSNNQRFINTVTGTSNATGQKVTKDCVYAWVDTAWVETQPESGDKRQLVFLNAIYMFDGSKWAETESALPKLEFRKDGDSIAWDIVE